jgi:hypothetical protein
MKKVNKWNGDIFVNSHLANYILEKSSVSPELLDLLRNFIDPQASCEEDTIMGNREYQQVFWSLPNIDKLKSKIRAIIDDCVEQHWFENTCEVIPGFARVLIENNQEDLERLMNYLINISDFDACLAKIQADKGVEDDVFKVKIVELPVQDVKIEDKGSLMKALKQRNLITQFLTAYPDLAETESEHEKKIRQMEADAICYYIDKFTIDECLYVFSELQKIWNDKLGNAYAAFAERIDKDIAFLDISYIQKYLDIIYPRRYANQKTQTDMQKNQHLIYTKVYQELTRRIITESITKEDFQKMVENSNGLDFAKLWRELEDINNHIFHSAIRTRKILGLEENHPSDILRGRTEAYHTLCNLAKAAVKFMGKDHAIFSWWREFYDRLEECVILLDEYNIPRESEVDSQNKDGFTYNKPKRRSEQYDDMLVELLTYTNGFQPAKMFFIANLCWTKKKFDELMFVVKKKKENQYTQVLNTISRADFGMLQAICEQFQVHTIDDFYALNDLFCKHDPHKFWIVGIKNHKKLKVIAGLGHSDIEKIVRILEFFMCIGYMNKDVSDTSLTQENIELLISLKNIDKFALQRRNWQERWWKILKEGNPEDIAKFIEDIKEGDERFSEIEKNIQHDRLITNISHE